jgi:hypothetical protein
MALEPAQDGVGVAVRGTEGEADDIELFGRNCPHGGAVVGDHGDLRIGVGDGHRTKMPAPLRSCRGRARREATDVKTGTSSA